MEAGKLNSTEKIEYKGIIWEESLTRIFGYEEGAIFRFMFSGERGS